MDAASPEPSKPTSDDLVKPQPVPPVKGNVVAKPKTASAVTKSKARELTPEQAKTQRRVSDFFYVEFEKARGEKPILDWKGKDRVTLNQLLDKLEWDGDKACEIISNAFRQKSFVEYRCKLSEILNNTTQYQGTPKSERRASSGQSEPDDSYWESRDERISEDVGS